MPQGSILGPLLFNIFIDDIFYIIDDNAQLCNYADDNSLYVIANNPDSIKIPLIKNFKQITKWFYENYMILNPGKCHYMFLGKKGESDNNQLILENVTLSASPSETLLGIIIDKKLTFDNHVTMLCKKTSQKLNALARLAKFMSFPQKKLLFNPFIKSQFNYCPLIWMFCSRTQNSKINSIHERALRIIYKNHTSSYCELLHLHQEKTVHQNNINTLMIEVYKYLNGLSPPIMKDIFKQRENIYNTRNFRPFSSHNLKTNIYGTESVTYKSSQIWNIIPNEIKEAKSLIAFKHSIKQWSCDNCPCRLCKLYIIDLRFV